MQGLTCSIYLALFVCLHASDQIFGLPPFQGEDEELDCPSVTDRFLPTPQIPWGTPGRAALTAPPEVELRQSSIPGAGTGAFATTFIHRNTWLAEYEGEIVHDDTFMSQYACVLTRDGVQVYLVDAHDERTSNWIRWINCSRHVKEQNVLMMQCRGRIYYITMKDVYPGEELLHYYGDGYAESLDIWTDFYYDMDVDINLYKKYACWNL